MTSLEFQIGQEEAGQRLDRLLAQRFPELTRSRIQQLMEQGLVLCGGRPAAKNTKPCLLYTSRCV